MSCVCVNKWSPLSAVSDLRNRLVTIPHHLAGSRDSIGRLWKAIEVEAVVHLLERFVRYAMPFWDFHRYRIHVVVNRRWLFKGLFEFVHNRQIGWKLYRSPCTDEWEPARTSVTVNPLGSNRKFCMHHLSCKDSWRTCTICSCTVSKMMSVRDESASRDRFRKILHARTYVFLLKRSCSMMCITIMYYSRYLHIWFENLHVGDESGFRPVKVKVEVAELLVYIMNRFEPLSIVPA